MGYSATAAAFDTLERIVREAGPEYGSNGWQAVNGRNYFYERGDEHTDGAITGTVLCNYLPSEWRAEWGTYNPNSCKAAGSFRIEPNGKVTRFAGIPKTLWEG